MRQRIFKKIGNEIRSALTADQIGAPHALLGVVLYDEDFDRALCRAYELGRKDHAADVRDLLGINI